MYKVKSCAICGGEVEDIVTRYFERYMAEIGIVVFENIPAQECTKCGEKFYAGEILKKSIRF